VQQAGRVRVSAAAVLAVSLLAAGGCAVEPMGPGSFYDAGAATLSGPPGKVLRVEPFPGAPAGATAYRVLYASTGLDNEPIAVSGVIVVPTGAPPADGRPVVAWAHPTTGVATRCAPSLQGDKLFKRIEGLDAMLARGFVVAATDYPGLGTAGTHPYLVGISEGRAVIDSVRAARGMEQAGAGKRYAVWGHSQGGQAVLFAGQLASSYAPDLSLAGVAAAAPATDLATLLRDDFASGTGKVLTAFALWSWHRVYGAPIAPVLDASAEPAVDGIAADCIEGDLEDLAVADLERLINKQFLHGDVTEIEPWKSLLAQNATGGAPAGAPVFFAQGTADKIVRPEVTFAYAGQLCARRTPVVFDWLDGVSHHDAGKKGAPGAVAWMADRLAGKPAPSQCGRLPAEPRTKTAG
jgi:alpha-beta hydrolase superfamily lysophospholipase